MSKRPKASPVPPPDATHLESQPVGPVSTAQEREIPNVPQYGVDVLALFERHTRATFEDAFGVEPPSWNTKWPIKRWFDSAAAEGVPHELYIYRSWVVENGKPVHKQFAITNEQAAAVNLPGLKAFPKYVVAPTDAYTVSVIGTVAGVNPRHLATKEQAEDIMVQIRGERLREATLTDGSSTIIYPEEEKRRIWEVQFKTDWHNVGLLLDTQGAAGVGAPGRWDLQGMSPAWVPEYQHTGAQDPRPEIPIPMRTLRPEEVASIGFAGVIQITRATVSTLPMTPFEQRVIAKLDGIQSGVGQLLQRKA